MPTEIVRQQTPEEAELLRKSEELAAVRAELAECELALADLHAQLKSFEGRYLRQVGVLYAELDEWEARIAELGASHDAKPATQQCAAEARQRAFESHKATHGEASKADDFQPSAELKSLFRDIAKLIHPDFAKDVADQERRTRLMAQANDAYRRGDSASLQSILSDHHEFSESIQGEGVGAKLIRMIRQLHQARKDIEIIVRKLADLKASELAQFKYDADMAQQEGRDLLAELAIDVGEQIAQRKKEHETLESEMNKRGK